MTLKGLEPSAPRLKVVCANQLRHKALIKDYNDKKSLITTLIIPHLILFHLFTSTFITFFYFLLFFIHYFFFHFFIHLCFFVCQPLRIFYLILLLLKKKKHQTTQHNQWPPLLTCFTPSSNPLMPCAHSATTSLSPSA